MVFSAVSYALNYVIECRQVNLGWQLDATAPDDGGFQILIGSHVGNYELPWEVRTLNRLAQTRL